MVSAGKVRIDSYVCKKPILSLEGDLNTKRGELIQYIQGRMFYISVTFYYKQMPGITLCLPL